jgi:hypothetical protein
MSRQLVVAILWISFTTSMSFSQEAGNSLASPALPVGNGAWVIRVFTSGGFSGAGNGNIAISSKGEIVCATRRPAACPKSFEVQPIQQLVDKFAGMDLSRIVNRIPAAPGICNDCINRLVILVWRDHTGIKHSYSASWDELTAAMVRREIVDIYNAIMALREVK